MAEPIDAMRGTVIFIASLLMIAATWAAWDRHAFNESKIQHHANVADFESDMTETLARQIFKDLQQDQPLAFFLAFGDHMTAPSQAFIARFDNVQPPVKDFQASVMPPNGMIIDTASGRVGAIVHIIKIKPVVVGEYDVEVAISKGGPGSDHFIYRLSGLGGEWRIKNRKPA
jgi:hypothetical protein